VFDAEVYDNFTLFSDVINVFQWPLGNYVNLNGVLKIQSRYDNCYLVLSILNSLLSSCTYKNTFLSNLASLDSVGELLGKMTGEKGDDDDHFDLHIDEDVLMVTKYNGRSIQYYNLDVEQLVHLWSIGGSDL
jgi:hypothetical protein